MKDKILELIKLHGPALPVDVSGKIGKDSFLTNAYLSELVAEGKLKASSEKVGAVPIYFLAGQEAAVQQKLDTIKARSAKTARTFQQAPVAQTSELAQKRIAFETKVQDILKAEQKAQPKPLMLFEKSFTQESPPPRPTIIPKQPILTFIRESVAQKPEITFDLQKESFEDKALKYLLEHKIEILQKEEGRRELNIVANVPTAVGPIKFLVKVKDKQKINRSDLTLAYTAALEQRMPALFLTNGIIASSAEKYLKEVGGILKIQVL